MVKLVAISDTHTHKLENILKGYEGDILVHAGDMLNYGSVKEWAAFYEDLKTVRTQFKEVIIVGGNHDICVSHTPALVKEELSLIGVHFLLDESITLMGVNFYGSPWVPHINGRWAWELPVSFSEDCPSVTARTWSKIPGNTDVLVTHTPPANILSYVWGCDWLAKRVMQVMPKVHIFGHVHSNYGHLNIKGIDFYNVATCNEAYKPVNKPVVIEIE